MCKSKAFIHPSLLGLILLALKRRFTDSNEEKMLRLIDYLLLSNYQLSGEVVISRDLMKDRFFEYLDFALQFAPAGPEEKEIRAKLARIGVGPGKTFNFKDLSPEHKLEAGLGMKAGNDKVNEKVAAIGKTINGWQVGSSFGDREYYRGDWLLRAAAARAGIYGNNAEEAMYPMTKALASGEPLDGGKRNYTLTFKPGRLPPVNAFWSVTMCTTAGRSCGRKWRNGNQELKQKCVEYKRPHIMGQRRAREE